MRIAVTGATGFVGRHLVEHLRAFGDDVVALSRTEQPGIDAVVDYLNASSLARVFRGCDVVQHLAARAHQRRSTDEAEAFERANVQTTVTVARACLEAGVRRMVLCSSIGVLGAGNLGRPVGARDEPAPTEPYAESKLAAERQVAEALAGSAVSFSILRPPLVYGPECPGNFRTLMRVAARLPLVPLGGLREPRTFVHVENLASALRVAGLHPEAAGRTFVVGDDEDLSVAEVVRIVAEVRGRPGSVISIPPAWLGMAMQLLGRKDTWAKLSAPLRVDSTEFLQATGWRPPRRAREAMRETARAFVGL